MTTLRSSTGLLLRSPEELKGLGEAFPRVMGVLCGDEEEDVVSLEFWLALEAYMVFGIRGRKKTVMQFASFKALREAVAEWQRRRDAPASRVRGLLQSIWSSAIVAKEENLEKLTLSRATIRGLLASAFFLNTRPQCALDFSSGGDDPLYVSSGRAAVEKLIGLLQYFSVTSHPEENQEMVSFERFRGATDFEDHKKVGFRVSESEEEEGILLVSDWSAGPQRAPAGNRVTQSEALIAAYPESYLALHVLSFAALNDDEVFVARNLRPCVHTTGAYHGFRAETTTIARAPGRTIVFADAPRTSSPRSRAAVDAALKKARAINAAVPDDEKDVVLYGGVWGAASFLDAADVVLRVIQLAVALKATVVVRSQDIHDKDKKRLTAISGALAKRNAQSTNLLQLMVHERNNDNTLEESGAAVPPFGRDLVAWLRKLPRTEREEDTTQQQQHEKKRPRLSASPTAEEKKEEY